MNSIRLSISANTFRKALILTGLVWCISFIGLSSARAQSRADRCNLKGRVFVEARRGMAQFSVFIEESEGLADVRVFKEDNPLFADKAGKWHFVKTRGLADFTIFIEETKNLADFTIFYTETEAFAGCQ